VSNLAQTDSPVLQYHPEFHPKESWAMLHDFITFNRDEIIARCRAKVAARKFPPPSEAEVNHGVQLFLEQLVDALRAGEAGEEIDRSARLHGHDLLRQGFTVSQVVHDYGDVCQTVTALAMETNAPISANDFSILNRCLDDAIAGAVTIYGLESEEIASARRRAEAGRSTERIGFLVHELRNLVTTAIFAFEVIKTGNVGVTGNTGAVLYRSLLGLKDLIAHSLNEVRMTAGDTHRTPIVVSSLIEEVALSAKLAADARGITLNVPAVEDGLVVSGDQQVLSAVVANLLQNAFKFTRPHSQVTLRARARESRLLIEVEDECGGLPGGGDGTEIAASFEQKASDRSGLGIGLAFSRWGAEVNGGRLYARNLPNLGCVFIVDLPRVRVHQGTVT
jgi:signal transduction histidine kinase